MEENKKDKLNDKEKKLNKVLDIVKWVCAGVAFVSLLCACVFSCVKKQTVEDVSNANSVVLNANVGPKRAKDTTNTNNNLLFDPFKRAHGQNANSSHSDSALTQAVQISPKSNNGYYVDDFTYTSTGQLRIDSAMSNPYENANWLGVLDETYVSYFAPALYTNGDWLKFDSSGSIFGFKYFVPSIQILNKSADIRIYTYCCLVDVSTGESSYTCPVVNLSDSSSYYYAQSITYPIKIKDLCSDEFINGGIYDANNNSGLNNYRYINNGRDTQYRMYIAFGWDNNTPNLTFDFILNGVCGDALYPHNTTVYNWYVDNHAPVLRSSSTTSDYSIGYNDGLAQGLEDKESYGDERYNQGLLDGEEFNFPSLIYTIFNAPYLILGGFLDFEIFGVNFKNLVFFLISVGIVLWVLSVFKRGK